MNEGGRRQEAGGRRQERVSEVSMQKARRYGYEYEYGGYMSKS